MPAFDAIALHLPAHCQPVALDKCYRLLNHGPTVLVSAAHAGEANVMAAAWACALDFAPPKVTVVLDKQTRTRALVEASGQFVLQLPTRAQRPLGGRLRRLAGVPTDCRAPQPVGLRPVHW